MSSTPPDFSTGLATILPDPDALQAIGELWVRLSQLEAWLDVGLGHLLGLGWSATQSVVANLNMKSKLDIADSLVALRIQRLGTSESRDLFQKIIIEIRKINEDRITFAHGRYLLDNPGDIGTLVRSHANKKYINHKSFTVDPHAVRLLCDKIKKLTVRLMQVLGYEFPNMDVYRFYAS